MKKLCVHDNIITFVNDGQHHEVAKLSDVELVQRLMDDPQVSEEIRALSRIVLLLATQHIRHR